VHVDDAVAVNLWFFDHPACRGIFNVGTGRSRTFNDVANAVIDWYGTGRIEYVAFPPELVGRYQSFTEADVGKLRADGYRREFLDVEEGVRRYLSALDRDDGRGRPPDAARGEREMC
jgi:ADP-L-glycero-D-manno-heptose 6-epimerase